MRLRGYLVGDRWDESAVLVFAHSAKEAKRRGWRTIVDDYGVDFYTDVRVRWSREADPKKWDVTEPCILEPRGCEQCERWYAAGPVDPTTGLCADCFNDDESWEAP